MVTKYDAKNKCYAVKYADGDIGEYTHQDITSYKKKKQAYTKKQYSTYLMGKQYDKNIFFVPTKASSNPIKSDYIRTKCLRDRQNASTLLKYKLDELRDKADANFHCIGHELAHAAIGHIWDKELAKMFSYQDLINHLNPTI